MSYYDLLGLARTASTDEIRKAYKAQALRFHPDRDNGTNAMFQRMLEAYEVLSSRERRREYDRSQSEISDSSEISDLSESEFESDEEKQHIPKTTPPVLPCDVHVSIRLFACDPIYRGRLPDEVFQYQGRLLRAREAYEISCFTRRTRFDLTRLYRITSVSAVYGFSFTFAPLSSHYSIRIRYGSSSSSELLPPLPLELPIMDGVEYCIKGLGLRGPASEQGDLYLHFVLSETADVDDPMSDQFVHQELVIRPTDLLIPSQSLRPTGLSFLPYLETVRVSTNQELAVHLSQFIRKFPVLTRVWLNYGIGVVVSSGKSIISFLEFLQSKRVDFLPVEEYEVLQEIIFTSKQFWHQQKILLAESGGTSIEDYAFPVEIFVADALPQPDLPRVIEEGMEILEKFRFFTMLQSERTFSSWSAVKIRQYNLGRARILHRLSPLQIELVVSEGTEIIRTWRRLQVVFLFSFIH